jgi:L-ascorbate metabolism protein UlaG (beta-lactamase superfamily)
MRVEWFGQSAFHLRSSQTSVFIDPFGDLTPLVAARGLHFDYPAIEGVEAELLLVTHEHIDHNGVEAIGGDPTILRSTAGRLESPIGDVIAIASEHDDAAGTHRGPNTIFSFELDGLRVCHFGDFGQRELRAEQLAAIGPVDLLFLPVGDGATIGAAAARTIAERLGPRWVVPMHYRTPRIGFLEPADAFLGLFDGVNTRATAAFDTDELESVEGSPVVVLPAVP